MTETLHPTALIDPRARLGAGVRVGAYTVVGPDVTLDDDVELGHHVVLEGQVFHPADPNARLYPVFFCRECGQEHHSVRVENSLDGV